jgi:poly(hydroxyalkanoate) depolymerase family esterase
MKMNDAFLASMREAMELLRTAGPLEATEAIQRALRTSSPWGSKEGSPAPAQVVEALLPADGSLFRNDVPLAKTPFASPLPGQARKVPSPSDVEVRGHFSLKTFANHAGQRAYKLYVPSSYRNEPVPLIVMLHGCTQDADDFAAGTRMNALAELHGFLVLYPIQPTEANPSKCWNWFRPGDQQSGRGEPSLIAGITREVMASHNVDADRVYIAGLSAGGAMAAVMIHRYPELYAAAGIHSGLPQGCAHDLPSALAAMKGGKRKGASRADAQASMAQPKRPVIVFHGDTDHTVHPSNGSRMIAPFEVGEALKRTERSSDGGGHAYTRQFVTAANGVDAEYWLIHGAPHAWAGGSSRGSFTDAKGPDASAEMVRFFLAHPQHR